MMIDSKELAKNFKKKPVEWRIAAVIHDGNWYDKEKWKKIAKATDAELEKWIKKHGQDLLISENGVSFRMAYASIVKWYEAEGIPLDERIIPKNFPPKLWGGYTEADAFISTPRRRVGTVTFTIVHEETLAKVKEVLKGIAVVRPDKKDTYKAYGLSAIYIKQTLSRELTEAQLEELDMKTRAILMRREIYDFPESWATEALQFYIKYARSILERAYSTLSIYLPEAGDIESQIIIWVMAAMEKFDETQGVPFSGYLSNVLQHWPYDLPDEYLGKELSEFQRNKSRAIKIAQDDKEYQGKQVPHDVLAKIMDIPLEVFIELNNRHETWLLERNATELTWEDSSNEKLGTQVGVTAHVDRDYNKVHKISLAALAAACVTNDWDSAYKFIGLIDKDELDTDIVSCLGIEFRAEFARAYKKLGQ